MEGAGSPWVAAMIPFAIDAAPKMRKQAKVMPAPRRNTIRPASIKKPMPAIANAAVVATDPQSACWTPGYRRHKAEDSPG